MKKNKPHKFWRWGWVLLILLVGCQSTGTQTSPSDPSPIVPLASPSAQASAPTLPPTVAEAPPTARQAGSPTPDTAMATPSVGGVAEPSPSVPTAPEQASVTSLPDPGQVRWVPVADGLEQPIGLANAADGSGRLFILEQPGRVRVLAEGQLLPEPFLDIAPKVKCCGEQGLLGLAFPPDFTDQGYFLVHYSDLSGDTMVARYRLAAGDLQRGDPASEYPVLQVRQPYRNHNGGQLAFGPDGYLYIGLGDGGSARDPENNGQSTGTLLGSILRLAVAAEGDYQIPPDNPFAAGGGRPEIWAYGLRNPWRFSFDPLTEDLYIGDVGQNAWEEIDYLPASSPPGVNFGWAYQEGTHAMRDNVPQGLELVPPVAEYAHEFGCSVTGGLVYRGEALPDWYGVYVYGDFCSGHIWGLVQDAGGAWQNEMLFSTGLSITAFGEDERGELYLADYSGTVYRLEPAG